MPRHSTLRELEALGGLTRQLEAIKRQFLGADRASAPSPPALTLRGPVDDVSIEDWDSLLHAVKARLRLTVGESLTQQLNGAAAPVQASVLECVEALDQLHTTLSHALARRAGEERPGASSAWGAGRRQVWQDDLVALASRSALRKQLDQALATDAAQRPRLALLYVDLDSLQPIHDIQRLEAGDALMRVVTARLAEAARGEALVCHLGGDEFACVCADWRNRAQLRRLAGTVFDTVSAPLSVGSLELSIRSSIGIAMSPTDATTADVLLECAQAAMVRAKRYQSGYAFFEPRRDQ